jgi:hypothetical protein
MFLSGEPHQEIALRRREPGLDVAKGGHENHRQVDQRGREEISEGEGRRIGRVKVVEHQKEWLVRGGGRQVAEHGVEESEAVGAECNGPGGNGLLGNDPRERGRKVEPSASEGARYLHPGPKCGGSTRFPRTAPGDQHSRGAGTMGCFIG